MQISIKFAHIDWMSIYLNMFYKKFFSPVKGVEHILNPFYVANMEVTEFELV